MHVSCIIIIKQERRLGVLALWIERELRREKRMKETGSNLSNLARIHVQL